jgi:hypothetical protein
VTLDDGSTDGQANSHAVILSRVERVEKPIHARRLETNPNVLHGQPHVICFVPFRSDQQVPRTALYAAHRVASVPHQVQDDLLKLHAISRDKQGIVN